MSFRLVITLVTALANINMPISAETMQNDNKVTVIYTTDVHGHFFPYNFITGKSDSGSLSRAATFIEQTRSTLGKENVVLLDNGDILQGQPTVYYYNFIDTVSPNIACEIYDFLQYDAATIGNHDIETGHPVYDRWRNNTSTPILGANVIEKSSGTPYLTPYKIINRGGIKIAVIGLLTPAIPAWLPERLWSGLEFLPMEETARKWIARIKQDEKPDIIIGLFHSGSDASKTTAGYIENASLDIARNVEGFDAVLMGHDHTIFCDTVITANGHTVHVLNPANNAHNVGVLTIEGNKTDGYTLSGNLKNVDQLTPSKDFISYFSHQFRAVKNFVGQKVTTITDDISTRDAFFGPSAFMSLLHRLQLDISRADISMAAPLTFDGSIKAGDMHIADMFTLYKYENMLCTLKLTGQEIKDYLEYSYSLWTNQITDCQPHLIKFASDNPTKTNNKLKHPSYNFDSASGIDYTVDVTKPAGEKVSIKGFSNGHTFSTDSIYTVAVNSYRAGGGGNHLTDGAGIPPEKLKQRIVSSTEKDLRYYLMQQLSNNNAISPRAELNWQFIPAKEVQKASETDHKLLFSPTSSKLQK